METIAADLAQLMRSHQYLVPFIVGLIAFGESLVLLGLIIPATALMLAIGGLIGSGIVQPIPVIAGAIAGAVAGDIVSYWLGRWVGPRIVHRRPLQRYRAQVAQARLFFRKYGFASIFFGRFLGPVRSTIPLVAGMMRMDQRRFQFANVSSAMVWAPVMLAPGWLAAEGAALAGADSGESWLIWMAGLMVVTLVVTGVAVKFINGRVARRPRRGRRAASTAGL